MAALFWLILAQALVLVLANTTDTNNDTLLYDDVDHDERIHYLHHASSPTPMQNHSCN